ncbi:MAG TPA: sulfotransferase family protein, partial [Thermoanaerobaculia bacterium]|nr:sulfotransferase family protein [Thermoanaerobaculia bacterium]
MPEPRILYVVGHPRSGSTIVGNVLGEMAGAFHAGEVHYLWTPGLPLPRQRCGCGEPVRECTLWRRAFASGFGAADDGPPAAADDAAATAWGL